MDDTSNLLVFDMLNQAKSSHQLPFLDNSKVFVDKM